MLLCLETSQSICSVALFEGETCIHSKEHQESNQHNKIITILIDELLQEAGVKRNQLSALALSAGPGSYTGLRVGSSAAKGITFGLNIPLIAVDTLKLIAYQASLEMPEADAYISQIDARRMEVYEQVYNSNLERITSPRAVILDEEYLGAFNQGKLVFCGNGAEKMRQLSDSGKQINILSEIVPMARFMGKFASQKFREKQFENSAYFEPFYLKSFGEKAVNEK